MATQANTVGISTQAQASFGITVLAKQVCILLN
jgi:hypothetical protein